MIIKVFGLIMYNMTGYFNTSINISISTMFTKILNIFSNISYCDEPDKYNLGLIVGVSVGVACIGLACYQYKKLKNEILNCKDNNFIIKNSTFNLDEKIHNFEIINIQKDSKILKVENLISVKEKTVNDLEVLESLKSNEFYNIENLNIQQTKELENLQNNMNNIDVILENKKMQVSDKYYEISRLKTKLVDKIDSLNFLKILLRKFQNKSYKSELEEKRFQLKDQI
jgi:hypothetical protein